MSGKSNLKINLIFLFILFGISLITTFLYFLFDGISLPYVGPNATNFNVYSLIAHNFNKFGYLETKLAPVISVSNVLPERPEYFFHHPTLLPFIESLFFRIFGENFWVGRMTVIIFALGSILLTFFIGKGLLGKRYGIVSALIMLLIPATAIFGRMIGQEPLVLFFGLLTLYSVLRYLDSSKKKFLFIASFSIILGILSDWPMVYFIPCFILLFVKHKKIKLGIYFTSLSLLTIIILLSYVYLMQSGFWDLKNALAHRTFTGLLQLSFWPFRWLVATLFRLIIYFNPILSIFSATTLWSILGRFKNKKLSNIDLTILGLFLFGALHLIIYAEASFTHPYLIYYLLPFIAFASSKVILNLFSKKQYIYLITIITFSLFYLFFLGMYKREQVLSNLWRYELTRTVSQYVSPYEEVLLNSSSVIDSDLLWYPFLINRKIVDENTSIEIKDKHNHYIYSCLGKCNSQSIQLNSLKNRYGFIYIVDSHAETYIFLLKQKKNQNTGEKQLPIREINLSKYSVTQTEGSQLIRQIYRLIMEILKVPQV